MDTNYRWNGIRFQKPERLVDETVVSFSDDIGGAAGLSITVAIDDIGSAASALEEYVSAQTNELKVSVPGYKLNRKEARTIEGRSCLMLYQSGRSNQGVMSQVQAYVQLGEQVVIVTGSSTSALADRAAREVENIVRTMEVDP